MQPEKFGNELGKRDRQPPVGAVGAIAKLEEQAVRGAILEKYQMNI